MALFFAGFFFPLAAASVSVSSLEAGTPVAIVAAIAVFSSSGNFSPSSSVFSGLDIHF